MSQRPTRTTPPPRPPRKVRSNKGKKRKPNVVLNNKGDEVLNAISQAPIPKEKAITVQTQKYNARELTRWFKVSGKRTVPHTRDELNHVDTLMVLYRAFGSRRILTEIIKKLNNLKSSVAASHKDDYRYLVALYKDIELFNYLFLQDYMNLTTYGEKVTLHPLPKGKSKKDDINYFKVICTMRYDKLHSLLSP